MRCQTCDYQLPEGVTFCPNCGAKVPTSSAGANTILIGTPTTPPPAPQPTTQPPAAPYTPFNPTGVPQGSYPSTVYAAPALPNSTAAVVSLVFGILSWTILPVIAPIIAIIAGHMAVAEIRRSQGATAGRGMAIAGLIMGYVQIGVLLLAVCAVIAIGALTLLGTKS